MAPEEAVERHRTAMLKASYRITENWDDAEDATSEAIVAALATRPQLGVDDWVPWLCKVAQRKAIDILRKRKKEQPLDETIPSVGEVLGDMSRDVELGVGTQKLFDRIRPFISRKQKENFELYCRIELNHVTEEDLARELQISQEALRSRLRRVAETAHNAAVAVCLADDPGVEPDRCIGPFSLVRRKAASPKLLREITSHIDGCETCREKRNEPRRLRSKSLLVPGIGLTAGLLAQLVRAMTRKKPATVMTVAAVAALTVGVLIEQPDAEPVPYPALPSPRTVAPSTGTTTPTTPPPTAAPLPPPRTVGSSSAAPAPVPPPAPLPTTTTTTFPIPDGGAREEAGPAISGGSVEHRKITTTERGRCGDKPTTSGVDATVTAPGGLRSVTAYLWRDGQEFAFPMTNIAGTSAWRGLLASEDTDGRFTVAVLAVGTNGEWTVAKIGELCIKTCS